MEQELIVHEVLRIRQSHPRIGVRKLYELLFYFMLDHQIKMGRDGLFDLLSINGMLIRRRKRSITTTNSFHWLRKYPNLIKDFIPTQSNELWVSDITYWKTSKNIFYISLITDAYSHKIVGYQVAETLAAIESIKALKLALKGIGKGFSGLIHHSDRGVQYCCGDYVKILQRYDIRISMTEKGNPLENAVAERVNGILKNEYLDYYLVKNIKKAKKLLNKVVQLYNEERPHMSIGNRKPNDIHFNNQKTIKLWKNYYAKKRMHVKPIQD